MVCRQPLGVRTGLSDDMVTRWLAGNTRDFTVKPLTPSGPPSEIHCEEKSGLGAGRAGQNWYYNQYWTGPPISKAEFHNKIIRRNYLETRYTRVHLKTSSPEIITLYTANISHFQYKFLIFWELVVSFLAIRWWDHIIIDIIDYPDFDIKFPIWGNLKVLTWSHLTTERKLSLFTQFQVR